MQRSVGRTFQAEGTAVRGLRTVSFRLCKFQNKELDFILFAVKSNWRVLSRRVVWPHLHFF